MTDINPILQKLYKIQQELNVPKNQRNNFGNYNYRSCEDILDALKPLLCEEGCTIQLNDEIVLIGERYYVKSTATLSNIEGNSINGIAYAREELDK